MTHVLIVGAQGVGKSTLINKVLEALGRPVSGFQTKKEATGADENLRNPVYIHVPGQPRHYTEENLLGYSAVGKGFTITQGVFDRYADVVRRPVAENGVILFDEIGFMEAREKEFCAAILERLDGNIPVIAAVKNKEGVPFLDTVRSHPNCRCFYIDEQNRDALYHEVLAFMQAQLNG
ncbi:MAG: AAA family ATPase [Clostridia bacterium]|nr:AAA family ATPase [Clostridia bacterium]